MFRSSEVLRRVGRRGFAFYLNVVGYKDFTRVERDVLDTVLSERSGI